MLASLSRSEKLAPRPSGVERHLSRIAIATSTNYCWPRVVLHAWRIRADLLLIMTTIKPRMPKMQNPERNVNAKNRSIFSGVNDARIAISSVTMDMISGNNNAHASTTRVPCLGESGSSPLKGKRMRRIRP